MSRQHTYIWSHPSHYLVDPYTWPWSPNGHGHGHEWPTPTPFVQCQSALSFWDTAISTFVCGQRSRSHLTLKIHWSHLRPGVQSICLLFFSWQSDHFWPKYSSSGQGHNKNQPKSNQVIYRSGPTIVPKMKEIKKVVHKLMPKQNLRLAVAYEPVQKHKVTPGIPGWLY